MASNFESMWAGLSQTLHDNVDKYLGDALSYAVDGVTFVSHPGFALDVVIGEESVAGLDDDFAVRKRVKIRKSIVPSVELSHRVRHPKLGAGTFRPTNSVPQTEGEYWLFDVQKVS